LRDELTLHPGESENQKGQRAGELLAKTVGQQPVAVKARPGKGWGRLEKKRESVGTNKIGGCQKHEQRKKKGKKG